LSKVETLRPARASTSDDDVSALGRGVPRIFGIDDMDFAISELPGWHSTIFPPFFVAGAIYSGFATVLTLLIPARKMFHLV
jgi:hypothetical protein